MRRDVVGLVAFDLVLRIIRGGAMRVTLVAEVAGVNFRDRSADMTCFRVPPNMIADLEFVRHIDTSESIGESWRIRPYSVLVRKTKWRMRSQSNLALNGMATPSVF